MASDPNEGNKSQAENSLAPLGWAFIGGIVGAPTCFALVLSYIWLTAARIDRAGPVVGEWALGALWSSVVVGFLIGAGAEVVIARKSKTKAVLTAAVLLVLSIGTVVAIFVSFGLLG